ncbi:hypothetical protein JG687_00011913 [Phytophthora cactorum]|uniref:Uncharacterized protein n=1 Tax=Phytophthora cactorum TaxID=29920 RepID=A0A8T1U718_9STRA|nr:hypothetical protein JG687_00011913 [Phytophthora cactorum]
MEGIDGIKMTEDVDLLAFWPGYGYATFDQLVGMNRIQEARHRQTLVMRTVKWIDEVEWRIQDLRKPFEDSPSCRQVGIQKLRRGNQPWNEPRAGRHARRASAVRFHVTVGTQRRIPGLGGYQSFFPRRLLTGAKATHRRWSWRRQS